LAFSQTVLFQSIGVFFTLRDLSLTFCKEVETQLPLTREQDCIQADDKLDLSKIVLFHGFSPTPIYAICVGKVFPKGGSSGGFFLPTRNYGNNLLLLNSIRKYQISKSRGP